MQVDDKALYIIKKLQQSGKEAYVVGGCVRDSLMGIQPNDWDICTSATPDETQRILGAKKTIPTGLQHGTVTVLVNNAPFEVTTFRTDGEYMDNRHPHSVRFVKTLKADLARRDFTINAMAFNPETGLVDYFGGKADIENGVLRCVGEAEKRINEDALRILRALRFMARFGFTADEKLRRVLFTHKNLLKNISVERIFAELKGMVVGDMVECVLLEYSRVLAVFIPEIASVVGFAQNNPNHDKDVWQHTAKAVGVASENICVRLALLFHNLGKAQSYTRDIHGVGHFYMHAEVGESIAKNILTRLKSDTKTKKRVCELVRFHDAQISVRRLPHWLNRLGEEALQQLIFVKRADILAQSPQYSAKRLAELDMLDQSLQKLIREGACFKIKDLDINGCDIIAVGVPKGEQVGRFLNLLLIEVLDGRLPNSKQILLQKVKLWLCAQEERECGR